MRKSSKINSIVAFIRTPPTNTSKACGWEPGNLVVFTIKKNYIYFNVTLLILMIYIILFPIISIPINKLIPGFSVCPYLRITGRPCPLCGGTRYIANFTRVFKDITYLFHPFGIIMIVIACETIFRIYNIINRKIEKSNKWIERDIDVHLLILNIFNLYEIIYIVIQLKTL